jgi:phosphohistidine phosphatase
LVEEGIDDAHKIGAWMKKNKHLPDLFITSPAIRAYGTAMAFARTWDYPLNKIKINKKLYECGVDGFMEVISSIKDEYDSVILFGHNPDITYTAFKLAKDFNDDLPTTGIVAIDFKVKSWEEITASKGELKFFKHP